jgi:hypothetical protein
MKKYLKRALRKLGRALHAPAEPQDLGLQDLKRELQRMATQRTAEYIRMNMKRIQSVRDAHSVHDVSIARAKIERGLVLEFGVFSGNSINYIASKKNWIVDGFDSFEGLPENWRDGYDRGFFSVNALPNVPANVRLHRGWFQDSIPRFLESLGDKGTPISYLHIDCDLYSSTKTIFEFLGNRIVSGTVIVFDEYFNYDGWEDGEFLAFKEFVKLNSIKYEYLTYNSTHEQVAVIIQ